MFTYMTRATFENVRTLNLPPTSQANPVKRRSTLMDEIRFKMFGSPDSLQKSVVSFEWRGLRLLTLNTCLNFWGIPIKRVGYVRGLP